jgi:hypothetical protein
LHRIGEYAAGFENQRSFLESQEHRLYHDVATSYSPFIMSLQVGFSAHSKELKSAYEQVIDNSSSVNWLIYTYDKGTNDLKVQATGEDGLEELSEEFIDGRIQYALARVTDPNTELPKLVFIAWVSMNSPLAFPTRPA